MNPLVISREQLAALLQAITQVRVGVLGNFCIDAYWEQDLSASEKSVETGLPTHPVREQRYELGGAGTIVNNLVAMGAGTVSVFGVVGPDPFGAEIQRLLDTKKIGRNGTLTQLTQWNTPVFVKPLRDGREQNRIDFGNFNQLHESIATDLLTRLEAALPTLDVVIVNQQIIRGLHTKFFQAALNALLERKPGKTFIVDCRHIAGAYHHCLHRLNEVEASRLCGRACEVDDLITEEQARAAAQQLFVRWGQPVFVSRGPRGVLVATETSVEQIPGLDIHGPTDSVGAGDSMLAGIAATLAAGHSPLEAALFGNFVAGVTVQKLFQTGTASPSEILAIGSTPDYVFNPELADDRRHARYYNDSEIELVIPLAGQPRITHAIFDHDGTISTLRQGWEDVMELVMIKAMLGEQYAEADETLYTRAVKRAHEFIDKTTGQTTLTQMTGLVKLVREFGVVAESDRLTEYQYKQIYLDELMGMVRGRCAKLKRGELDVTDFLVKNVRQLLQRLHGHGVQLHLASGTDEKEVILEAETLGYAPLFEGRIHGAVGDVTVDAKRMVLDRILQEIGPAKMTQAVSFGDGPAEIRETRKRGGLTVGVAADEVRRYGLDAGKRSRLIRAGAHIIVPDYSQLDVLLKLLGFQ